MRDLKCGIRSAIGTIAGVEATTLYGGTSDLSKTMLRYAERVCEMCQEQFATVGRPDRDANCERVMRSCVDRIVQAHRSEPIRNLPAYLQGELKRCTHLGDVCGDELLMELRSAGSERPAVASEPRRIGDVVSALDVPLAAGQA